MNCQEAIERLPWWLNGSLESAERSEVEEHLRGCASCRQALDETRLAWEIYGQHIPSEALVAYAFHERPEGIDPALLERHLADCPDCAAELELARASRFLGEYEDDEVAVITRRGVPAVVRPARQRGWQAAALAAGLTGLIAIGGWIHQSQETARLAARNASVLRGAAAPVTDSGVGEKEAMTFEVPSIVERGAASKLTIPTWNGPVVFLVPPVRNDAAPHHSFSLRDAAGAVRASAPIQLSKGIDSFTVIIPGRQMPPGDYILQIYAEGDAPLKSIPITVH